MNKTHKIYAKVNPEVRKKAIERLSIQIVSEDKTTLDEKENLANWLKTQI